MDEWEQRITSAAKDTLEELKKEGAVDADLEFDALTCEDIRSDESEMPRYDCTITFKRASGNDSSLQVRFPMRAFEYDEYGTVAQHVRKQLTEKTGSTDENSNP